MTELLFTDVCEPAASARCEPLSLDEQIAAKKAELVALHAQKRAADREQILKCPCGAEVAVKHATNIDVLYYWEEGHSGEWRVSHRRWTHDVCTLEYRLPRNVEIPASLFGGTKSNYS